METLDRFITSIIVINTIIVIVVIIVIMFIFDKNMISQDSGVLEPTRSVTFSGWYTYLS